MTLPTLAVGGMERFQLQLAAELIRKGHRVSVLALHDDGVLATDFRNVGAFVGATPPPDPGLLGMLRARVLRQELRALEVEVLHSVSGVWLPSASGAAALGLGLVHVQHGLELRRDLRNRLVLRLASRRTPVVVAVSREAAEDASRIAAVPLAAIEVIANGLRIPPTTRDDVDLGYRDRLNISRDAFVVGCLARFDRVKNVPLLVDAFARFRALCPERPTHLVLAGDGPERPSIEETIRAHGLEACVHLPGMVRDPAALLGTLDCCVLASLTEGTPMSLIEAMAAGVPVVATAVGGIPELLDDGRAGWLATPQDPMALAQQLLAVASVAEDVSRRVRRARQIVEERFEIGAVAERYLALYRAAMARPGARPSSPN